MPDADGSIRVTIRLRSDRAAAVRKACEPLGIDTLTASVQYLIMLGLQHSQASAAAMRIAEENNQMLGILREQASLNERMCQAAGIGEEKGVKKSSLGDPLEVPPIIFNTTCNNADQKRGEKTKKT